ncbi:MAG: Kelch repeat-containing protein [Gemmatimonadota bacterium]
MEQGTRAGRTLRIALAAMLLAAAGVLPAAAQDRPTVLRTRVTNAYPAYSPDGSRIAYMSNADGDFDIYVMEPDSGTIAKLTDAPGQDGTPVWSPDGSRIAFRSYRDGPSQIYVMDADGSEERNLSSTASHDEHPFWSPDGQRIYFASDRSAVGEGDENSDLYVMDADGSNVQRITSTPEIETYPTLSPDGTRLATRRILADGNWEVVVIDLEGNNVANLSNHPGFDGWPAWSPDGARLVFASDRSGSSDLWMVDADGSNLQRLTDDPADDRQAWWSPDGNRIAFARYVWFPDEPFYEASEILEIQVRKPTPATAPPRARVPYSLAPDRVDAQAEARQPASRAHHRLVSHPAGEVLLIGGSTRTNDGYVWLDDVWTWRSGGWSRSGSLPLDRSSHAVVYDQVRGEIVLVGGIGGRGEIPDGTVRVLSEEGWEARAERLDDGWSEAAACYDHLRGRVVVFGGWDRDDELRGDTWEWNGRELVRVATTGPAPRAGHEMAFDPVSGRCILFGGGGEAGLFADTWAWDGETWQRIATDGPPQRWFFGMATADDWDRVVLFGGATDNGNLADTWQWDGRSWRQTHTTGPPPRGMSRIAFDGEHIVLFGGRQERLGESPFVDLADTWLFDGERWSRWRP